MFTFRPVQGVRVAIMVEPSRRYLAACGALALSGCVLPPLPNDTDPATDTSAGSDSLSMTSTVGPGTSEPEADTAGDTDDALSVGETGPASTGTGSSTGLGSDSGTSGDSGTTGDGETDADGSTEESGSESGTDTGGDPGPPASGCEAMCDPGCDEVLIASMQGLSTLWHTATARLALDEAGRAVLWRVADDVVLDRVDGVVAADLAGDTLALQQGVSVSIRDPDTAGQLATIGVGLGTWGLARDGGYVWVVDAVGLRLYDTDGTLRWQRPGDYDNAHVLALAGSIHVHAPALGVDLEHIDAVTEAVSTTTFQGTFGGWFYDQPRHWTRQGDAYRLYESDGSQLAFAVGTPVHGYGDRLAVEGFFAVDVVDIADVTTPLLEISDEAISGVAIIGNGNSGDAQIVRLDDPALVPQPVTTSCCTDAIGNYRFGFADGRWFLSGNEGEVYDDDGDLLAPGTVEHVFGSPSGRVAASTNIGLTFGWEVTPACELSGLGSFERPRRPAMFSGDGQTLVSVRSFPQLSIELYDVATWTVFDSALYGLGTSTHIGLDVSDAADVIGVSSFNTAAYNSLVYSYPSWDMWSAGSWTPTPAVAPNGTLAVRGDSLHGLNATFEGALSYLHDGTGLVGIFDGVARGFVDDDTLLVAHYEDDPSCPFAPFNPGECDVLVGVELVDAAGLVIAASPIPDPNRFQRVSSTEVLLPEPPAIYDIYTGDLLWSGAPGPVAAVGADHVAHTVGGDLVLTRWR